MTTSEQLRREVAENVDRQGDLTRRRDEIRAAQDHPEPKPEVGYSDAALDDAELVWERSRNGASTGGLLRDTATIVAAREASYGPPAEHWGKAAQIANILLDLNLSAETWGKLWIIDKLVRDGTVAQRDNLADIAGYADGIDRVRGGE